ncbi:hypothetical protein [Actinoplanes aureus]|uniref:Uncharacterized protein n=1 Tax=Actinoplanes aureus TaxID=2792083 RepID=A0A931CKA4_9ACTN|nr:hypothetical protein [Actinoplanes aureus]MBG0569242.1 hypothetical protein [Actinoplanes aureus]
MTAANLQTYSRAIDSGQSMKISVAADPTPIMAGVTTGDWLAIGAGVVSGILTALVAIAIARVQRFSQLGDRAQDLADQRAEQARLAQQERERQNRQARRYARQHQYLETNEVLRLGQQIEWQVRNNGPYTKTELDHLRIGELAMEAEQLAARGPDRLSSPLQRVSKAASRLQQMAMPDVTDRPTSPSPGNVTTVAITHAEFRRAIQQDRLAHKLGEELQGAWNALTEEWGS